MVKFYKFSKKYKLNLKINNASKPFIEKLKNISNPERKRKIIGNLFYKSSRKEAKNTKILNFWSKHFYPDIIEKSLQEARHQKLNQTQCRWFT